MTNSENVRNMTDEELAKLIAYACDCDDVGGFSCRQKTCADCVFEWLKREAQE